MHDQPLYEIKADLFRGLAHPLRVRILEIVTAEQEVPVSAIIEDTGLKPSNLSQHLAVLRRYGLLVSERRGSQVYCRAADPGVGELLVAARVVLSRTLDARLRISGGLEAPPITRVASVSE